MTRPLDIHVPVETLLTLQGLHGRAHARRGLPDADGALRTLNRSMQYALLTNDYALFAHRARDLGLGLPPRQGFDSWANLDDLGALYLDFVETLPSAAELDQARQVVHHLGPAMVTASRFANPERRDALAVSGCLGHVYATQQAEKPVPMATREEQAALVELQQRLEQHIGGISPAMAAFLEGRTGVESLGMLPLSYPLSPGTRTLPDILSQLLDSVELHLGTLGPARPAEDSLTLRELMVTLLGELSSTEAPLSLKAQLLEHVSAQLRSKPHLKRAALSGFLESLAVQVRACAERSAGG